MKFIRFVVDRIDHKSGQRLGIIRAAATTVVNQKDKEELDELQDWFNDFLQVPSGLSDTTISWFKETATLFIRKASEIAEIIDKYERTEMIVTDDPGQIVYSDEEQILTVREAHGHRRIQGDFHSGHNQRNCRTNHEKALQGSSY